MEDDPPKVKQYKKVLKQLATNGYHRPPLMGALEVSLIFYRPVQKSLSKSEKQRRLNNEIKPVVKPDMDNYIKSTLDALNGILWHDDAQIVRLTGEKRYSDRPHILITVGKLNRETKKARSKINGSCLFSI